MTQVTEQQVLEALKEVLDPDRGKDIVSLDMVSGLRIKDGHVAFAIQVDPERGASMEPLRHEAEKTVHALPGVISATVVLTAELAAGDGDKAGVVHIWVVVRDGRGGIDWLERDLLIDAN